MKKAMSYIRTAGVMLAFLMLLATAYKAAFGITYLAKYLYYDNHSWGTIEYRSDIMTATGEYRKQSNPSYINMQMSLDEPVEGEEIYSITFKADSREDNWGDRKGMRALAVYSDFHNSRGDILTKADIIASLICGGYVLVFITVFIIALIRSTDNNFDLNKQDIRR